MTERELTEEEVADLKEAFAMFDINGDGRLFYGMNLAQNFRHLRLCAFPVCMLCSRIIATAS